MTTDQSITAVFSLLPYYIVSVTTPASRVRSQDSRIDITQPVIGEGFLYLANSIVTLSTVAPISVFVGVGVKVFVGVLVGVSVFVGVLVGVDVNVGVTVGVSGC